MTSSQIKHVPKGWGYEKWIVNNELYCGKLLFFNAGKRCSWHYHKLKDETFYIQSGEILLIYGESDDMEKAHVITDFIRRGFEEGEFEMLTDGTEPVSYTHLTLPTIYSV